MAKKIIIAILILTALGAAGWYFIYLQNKPYLIPSDEQESPLIIIGYSDWSGYAGLFIAADKGYFRDEGLNVEIKPFSLGELSGVYRKKEIHGRANLTLDAIDEAYSGINHKAVLVFDYSNGSDGIIAHTSIKGISDLREKKVAVELGTLEEFFLLYALQQYGLNFSDIIPINLDAEKSADAFVAEMVDAAVTYEPFMSKALEQLEGSKIFSSVQTPNLIVDVLTFPTDFLDSHRGEIKKIMAAYFRAIDFWKNNPAAANEIIAKYLNITAEEVAASLRGIKILDKRENQNSLSLFTGSVSLYANLRRVGEFIRATRYSEKPRIDTDVLIDDEFVKQ